MPIQQNELLFSFLLRHHRYLGNSKFSTTCNEAFEMQGNENNVLFPKNVLVCLNAINVSKEEYISKHSALPFYRTFTTKEKYEYACRRMFVGMRNYHTTLRLHSDMSLRTSFLYYCPECLKERLSYESITAVQQIEEVTVCHKHGCKLKSISINDPLLFDDLSNWDLESTFFNSDSVEMDVAKDVAFIIENNIDLNIDIIKELILYEEVDNHLKKKKPGEPYFSAPWEAYYSRLPKEYAKYKERVCFERFDGRAHYKDVEPAEYLIFIRSLFGSFEEFYNKYKNYIS